MTTKVQDILLRIVVWIMVIIFIVLISTAFGIVSYRILYRGLVYETVYGVLKTERVLYLQEKICRHIYGSSEPKQEDK